MDWLGTQEEEGGKVQGGASAEVSSRSVSPTSYALRPTVSTVQYVLRSFYGLLMVKDEDRQVSLVSKLYLANDLDLSLRWAISTKSISTR